MGSHHKSSHCTVASHLLQSHRKCESEPVCEEQKALVCCPVIEMAGCLHVGLQSPFSGKSALGGHGCNATLMFVTIIANASSALLGRDMTKSPCLWARCLCWEDVGRIYLFVLIKVNFCPRTVGPLRITSFVNTLLLVFPFIISLDP